VTWRTILILNRHINVEVHDDRHIVTRTRNKGTELRITRWKAEATFFKNWFK